MVLLMTEEDEANKRSYYGLDRVLAISDCVFAFAVTLLVLDLAVPALSSGATSADLWEALSKEYVGFISYLLSFFIAAIWWSAHHRNFRYIRNSDLTLSWLNLLFLLWIALLPFFTKILEQYGNLQIAVVLYAADQAAAGFLLTLSWWYASLNHRLVDENLKSSAIRWVLRRDAIAPVFFVVSIGVSFISPTAAFMFWFGMIPVLIIASRLERKGGKQ